MDVRGGLGVRVGGCLGDIYMANGMCRALVLGLDASCSLIIFCLCAMMPSNLVCAIEQRLLKRVSAILLSWKRAVELVPGVLCLLRLH